MHSISKAALMLITEVKVAGGWSVFSLGISRVLAQCSIYHVPKSWGGKDVCNRSFCEENT